jgi:putative CocE/NonD family hydrolase
VERRPDVLVYSTEVLSSPVEVAGPIRVELHAASTAPDTDFTAKLVDVHPDGRAELVTDGILRMRFRDSFARPRPLLPGEVYEIEVDMRATAIVLAGGHRIGLEVSSSNFPRFDANTNTGGVIAAEYESAVVVARNTVHHGPDRRSRLILPVAR